MTVEVRERPERVRPMPICLGCLWVLVGDGGLACDVHPDGIAEATVVAEGCEKFEDEASDPW